MLTGILENRFLYDAVRWPFPSKPISGHVEWKCPSNIALIKYWGKTPVQIPNNPSVSFTLSDCYTLMDVHFAFDPDHQFSLDYKFNGGNHPAFRDRLTRYFKNISTFLPFLHHSILKVNAINSFPHSAGIASSASSFGALALALCSIEEQIGEFKFDVEHFFSKASFLARLGSGSAARSVYGGIVLWGETTEYSRSSDEVAIPLNDEINPIYRNFKDSILIVSSEPKVLSSSAGHKLMEDHPYKKARIAQAHANLSKLLKTFRNDDLNDFIDIIENEALSLHSMIMTSKHPEILLKPNTLEIINHITNFRQNSGLPVGFTLDAGANVHVLYPLSISEKVISFIESVLKQFCENGRIIHDHIGNGPEQNT